MARDTVRKAGWGRSDVQTFTIPASADGSGVDAIDLERNYAFIVVKCEDCSNIPSSTSLSFEVGYDNSDTLCDLYEQDDPSTIYSKGDLPTSGTLAFLLNHAAGAQRLRPVLSNNASGGSVVFKVYGWDGGVY